MSRVETLLHCVTRGRTASKRTFCRMFFFASNSTTSLANWTSWVIYTIVVGERDSMWRFVQSRRPLHAPSNRRLLYEREPRLKPKIYFIHPSSRVPPRFISLCSRWSALYPSPPPRRRNDVKWTRESRRVAVLLNIYISLSTYFVLHGTWLQTMT